MSILLALALAADTPSDAIEAIPSYHLAGEKWACRFKSFGGDDHVIAYFGVFRTHVEDEFGSDNFIVQNDENALVFVDSSIGHEDTDAKILRIATVTMIERKGMRRFKRSIVDLLGNPTERIGTCAPY